MPHEEVIDLLETDPNKGLDLLEISHRKERFGANVLTAKKSKWKMGTVLFNVKLLELFNNPLMNYC